MARILKMTFASFLAISWALAPDTVRSAEAKAIPFPPDAEKLQFTAWAGDIEFVSPSSFKAVAAFYLDEMASRGWELDVSEVEVDDDSVDMVFRAGKLTVDMRISQWSKETRVSMDCEGLDFVDADNPTKLAEAGVPIPQAVLFFNREVPLPVGVTEVMHRGDGVMVYSVQTVDEAFNYYTGIVKRKGFRETRRPIITDSRRYTELKKGVVDISVNVFSHEDGSRSVLVYEDLQAPRVALLPTPATLGLRSAGEAAEKADAGSTADLAEESGHATTPIGASINQGQAVAKHGEKTYTFSNVACFQTKDRGDYATMLVFSAKSPDSRRVEDISVSSGEQIHSPIAGPNPSCSHRARLESWLPSRQRTNRSVR